MSDPLIIAGQEFGSRLFLGTAGYPNRKIMLDAVEASGTAMVTASIRRISLAGDDESLIDLLAGPRALSAQHRRLPDREGCRAHRAARPRSARHQLDQARSDRRPRAALSRCRGVGPRDRNAGRRRLRRAALLHRRSGDLPQTCRCRRRRRHAARLADRLRARHFQSASDRACLRALAGAGGARCRHRHRLRCDVRHGARLRRGSSQHGGVESARSGADGEKHARGGGSRPAVAARRTHRQKTHAEPSSPQLGLVGT